MVKNKSLVFLMMLVLALLVLGETIIPWAYVNHANSNRKYIGYYSIWNKPTLKSSVEMRKEFNLPVDASVSNIEVKPFNFLLNLQRSALLAFIGAILLGFRAQRRLLKLFAIFVGVVGLFFSSLLVLTLTQVR